MRFIYLLSCFFFLTFMASGIALAQSKPDTIQPGKGLQTNLLKPGLRQYLILFQNPAKTRNLGFWYWLRDMRITNHNGVNMLAVDQQWFGADSSAYRSVFSLNSMTDFAPLYHREGSGTKIRAYNWTAGAITSADTVEGNLARNFSLRFENPNYNWNLDIETFEMLPLAAGKSFLINFYDAGLDPPAYVLYTVIGSEELSLLDGQKADCWKLGTQGKDKQGGLYSETYWISKNGHEFLKEEDAFSGMFRYKIKMPTMTPDIGKGFRQ